MTFFFLEHYQGGPVLFISAVIYSSPCDSSLFHCFLAALTVNDSLLADQLGFGEFFNSYKNYSLTLFFS